MPMIRKPPTSISRVMQEWWVSVTATFVLDDHHIYLLASACEMFDRAAEAAAILKKQGLTFKDSHGNPRTRPEVNIERNARIAFARLVRELGLEAASAPDPREQYRPEWARNGKHAGPSKN